MKDQFNDSFQVIGSGGNIMSVEPAVAVWMGLTYGQYVDLAQQREILIRGIDVFLFERYILDAFERK